MNAQWKSLLAAHGAQWSGDEPAPQFAPARDEIRTAATRDVLIDLSGLALVRVTGADAQTYLQGQLSNDIRSVDAIRSQLSSYSTPKGRMLAVFRIFRRGDDFLLQLPGEIADDVVKRLRMFVMRSKVVLERAEEEFGCFGLYGASVGEVATPLLGELPVAPDGCTTRNDVTILALPGSAVRLEVIAPVDTAVTLWRALAAHCQPVGMAAWRWLDIEAGIPAVFTKTIEEFVPQMANLELVGGVNFKKGCYPGQEIVARMQYLGQLKQRMYRAVVDAADCPPPGTKLYTPEHGEQAAGTVVDAQPAPNGGCDLLGVIRLADAEGAAVHLGDPAGPLLGFRPLPYVVPALEKKSAK